MKSAEILGKAKWMTFGTDNCFPILKGEFNLKKPNAAVITVGCFGIYELYINGKRVGDDIFTPVTSDYHDITETSVEDKFYYSKAFGEQLGHRAYCPKTDITDYVKDGNNEICFFLGAAWYKMYSDDVKLACKIDCVCDGKNDIIYPEDTFSYIKSFVNDYKFTRFECHDYTICDADIAAVLNSVDKYEWKKPIFIDAPDTEYYVQECPADKIKRHLKPMLINETESCRVYDIGENISGWAVIKTNAKHGEKIKVRVCENLTPDKMIDDERYLGQYSEYISNGKCLTVHPRFMWHGFRYIEVTKNAEATDAILVHSDIEVTSDFVCDDKTINWLYSAYIRTQLDNMHMGIPSDCPHLEKRGYTGDGQLCADTVMMLFDSESFYRKWMEDISDCQDRKSGHIQYTAPYVHSGGGPGGWGCAIAHVPYAFYKIYGDIKPAEKYYQQMKNYLSYLEEHSEDDFVVSDQKGDWCLGDWCSPNQRGDKRPDIPNDYVNNYFYVRTLNETAEIAKLLGKDEDCEELLKTAEIKKNAIIRKYFDEKTGDFAGNIEGANAFALDINLGDERTLKNLAATYQKHANFDTGIFGTDLVPKILFKNGFGDLASKLYAAKGYPSFGYWMNYGSTTLWEEWHMPRSKNHPMFGACVRYLFTEILGIKQPENEAGYKNIVIKPFLPENLNFAKGFVTVGGKKTAIELTRLDSGLRIKIDVKNAKNVSLAYGEKTFGLKDGVNTFIV